MANRDRLGVLATLALAFFGGGLFGALGFKYVGYSLTIPLALLLVLLASVPAVDDLRGFVRKHRQRSFEP